MMVPAMSEPGNATSPSAPTGPAPGSLVVHLGDHTIGVAMVGGGEWTLPLGVVSLVEGPLERADRPRPEQLTNALGAVTDHLDDVVIESPIVGAAPAVTFAGIHAEMVGRVEMGVDELPADYVLERADADDVFRTIVAEPRADRAHNPGLDPEHVDTIIAGCCAVLAVLRRLDLQRADIDRTSVHQHEVRA